MCAPDSPAMCIGFPSRIFRTRHHLVGRVLSGQEVSWDKGGDLYHNNVSRLQARPLAAPRLLLPQVPSLMAPPN